MRIRKITSLLTALIISAGAVSPAMAAGTEGASIADSGVKPLFPRN